MGAPWSWRMVCAAMWVSTPPLAGSLTSSWEPWLRQKGVCVSPSKYRCVSPESHFQVTATWCQLPSVLHPEPSQPDPGALTNGIPNLPSCDHQTLLGHMTRVLEPTLT